MSEQMTASVARLLERYGYDVTYSKTATGEYDTTTGAPASTSESTEVVRGVFLNYLDAEIDGTLVKRGDRKLVFQMGTGVSATPNIGDKATGGGTEGTIVSIRHVTTGRGSVAIVAQTRT